MLQYVTIFENNIYFEINKEKLSAVDIHNLHYFIYKNCEVLLWEDWGSVRFYHIVKG